MSTSTATFLTSEPAFTIFVVVITAVITGFVTYWFGFRQYLKERRWERVRKTYIEDGLGKVIDGTDQLSTACYLNYGKSTLVFNLLESTVEEPEKAKETAKKIFSEMERANLAPNYGMLKLAIFNNQPIILLVVQMWMEFQQLAETIRHIGWQGIEDYFSGQQTRTEEERRSFLSDQKKIIREEWNKVIRKYEPLKGHLLRLQIEVDKMDILRVEDIDKIAQQSEIKKILAEIGTQYKSEIDKLPGSANEGE
ncbi:MAG: hypothetical protein HYT12_01190 [Candidatus Liptonbacteria bacterium]|nr:hypothetical protein [Candidatus Liptonbacteria bacterium]